MSTPVSSRLHFQTAFRIHSQDSNQTIISVANSIQIWILEKTYGQGELPTSLFLQGGQWRFWAQELTVSVEKQDSQFVAWSLFFQEKDSDPEANRFWYTDIGLSGLNLLVAAIILWNTTYLQRAVDHLRIQGHHPASGDLAHLSPLGWEHINLTGDYRWDTSPTLGPDEFRPLRTHARDFAAAA